MSEDSEAVAGSCATEPGEAAATGGANPATATRSGHPAVNAAIDAIDNARQLAPADQIAQYEAAHRTFQETLSTIEQA